MAEAGKLLIAVGVVVVLAGIGLVLFGRFSLPGDLTYRRGNFTLYAPLGTMILISVLLTVILNVLIRLGR